MSSNASKLPEIKQDTTLTAFPRAQSMFERADDSVEDKKKSMFKTLVVPPTHKREQPFTEEDFIEQTIDHVPVGEDDSVHGADLRNPTHLWG